MHRKCRASKAYQINLRRVELQIRASFHRPSVMAGFPAILPFSASLQFLDSAVWGLWRQENFLG